MSDNLPERVQILCHAHIICITVLENRIICCQIFCDLLLKSAFEWIFKVMQLFLVKIKWHIKWKYLIKKFHNICLSYYFKINFTNHYNWNDNLLIQKLHAIVKAWQIFVPSHTKIDNLFCLKIWRERMTYKYLFLHIQIVIDLA